jgi:hypothetical protein
MRVPWPRPVVRHRKVAATSPSGPFPCTSTNQVPGGPAGGTVQVDPDAGVASTAYAGAHGRPLRRKYVWNRQPGDAWNPNLAADPGAAST